MTKHPESVVGTYANRMIHAPTDQLMIGPHLIDTDGNVRTVRELVDVRITATAKHLRDPENMVYCLGMAGELSAIYASRSRPSTTSESPRWRAPVERVQSLSSAPVPVQGSRRI